MCFSIEDCQQFDTSQNCGWQNIGRGYLDQSEGQDGYAESWGCGLEVSRRAKIRDVIELSIWKHFWYQLEPRSRSLVGTEGRGGKLLRPLYLNFTSIPHQMLPLDFKNGSEVFGRQPRIERCAESRSRGIGNCWGDNGQGGEGNGYRFCRFQSRVQSYDDINLCFIIEKIMRKIRRNWKDNLGSYSSFKMCMATKK